MTVITAKSILDQTDTSTLSEVMLKFSEVVFNQTKTGKVNPITQFANTAIKQNDQTQTQNYSTQTQTQVANTVIQKTNAPTKLPDGECYCCCTKVPTFELLKAHFANCPASNHVCDNCGEFGHMENACKKWRNKRRPRKYFPSNALPPPQSQSKKSTQTQVQKSYNTIETSDGQDDTKKE